MGKLAERAKRLDPEKIPKFLRGDRRRATLAAISCAVIFIVVVIVVGDHMLGTPSEAAPERGAATFHLFTICSNLVSALGCLLSIPFAVEGIRKDSYHIPEWCITILYMGATSVSITFLFTVCIMAPVMGLDYAFGRHNFFMHLVCPALCICAFLFLESEHLMTRKHGLIALIPFFVYAAVYIFNVVILGPEASGWRDIYRMNTVVPVYVSLPIMVAIGLVLNWALGVLHNHISQLQAAYDERTDITFSERGYDNLESAVAALAEKHAKRSTATEYLVVPKRTIAEICAKYDDAHTVNNMCRMYLDCLIDARERQEGQPGGNS